MMIPSDLQTFPFDALTAIFNHKVAHYYMKSTTDFATDIDLQAEHLILNWIRSGFPQEAILSEESASETILDTTYAWIVDPLDGTYNFSLGLPYFGVQLVRLQKASPIMALIWLPELQLLSYFANGKTTCYKRSSDGQLLQMSKANKAQGIKTLSFGDFSKSNPASNSLQGQLMAACSQHFSKVRIHGASSVDFCLLAAGLTQGHVLFSTRPWELQPGLACCIGAGLTHCQLLIDHSSYRGFCHLIGSKDTVDRLQAIIESLF